MNLLRNKNASRTLRERFSFFEQEALPLLMLFAFVASLGMLWWSYANGFAVAYGDAASHLNIARRSIDGLTPGAAQLGGVWLPLHHILMLFFVWNDTLWQTGLAGGIIGSLSFLGIVYCTFRLAELLTNNRIAAFIASLVVLCNPNLLYLQTTPMGESLFLFTLTASAYLLTRWCFTRTLGSLILAATFGFLSTFIRYEGWFFIAAELLVVLWIAYRHGGFRRAEGLGLAFALLTGFGPLMWLLWNWAIFGSPFYFLSGDFSARAQQLVFEEANLLPTAHNLFLSLKYYFFSVGETNGFLLGWLSLLLLPFLWWEKRYRPAIFVFLAVAAFEVISLYFGMTALYLPYFFPYDSLFNVRYGLLVLPLAALSVAHLLSKRHFFLEGSMGVLIVLQIFFLYRELPITLLEPLQVREVSQNKQAAGGEFLKQAYQGGRVLVIPVSNDPFMFHAALPMREFITEGNREYWEQALHRPENNAEWIVYDSGINYFALKERGSIDFALEHFYRLEWSRKGLFIYHRIPKTLSSSVVSSGP